MALTFEQYKKLKEAGYTPEKIAELEKRRTSETKTKAVAEAPSKTDNSFLSGVASFLGDTVKSIVKPIAQSVVAPAQAIQTIRNVVSAPKEAEVKSQTDETTRLYKRAKELESQGQQNSEEYKQIMNTFKESSEKELPKTYKTTVNAGVLGELEAPKTFKEVAGTGLETIAAGLGGAGGKVASTAGKSLIKRIVTGPGAKIGAAYGAGEELKENKSLVDVAKGAALGAGTGALFDVALLKGGQGLKKLGEKIQKPTTKTAQKTKEEIAGKIIDGETKDKAPGVKALESIDTKGVKTFEDLETKLSNKITELSKNIDKKLDKDTSVQKLKDIVTKAKSISGKEVKTNYVKTALEHLQEVYRKTGDNVGVQNIKDTIKKATTTGLTKKEINNIARSYGVEFGKKAFSKTGEPLTSVNSKLYETVRKGLKEKARETAAGLGTKEMDKTMSAIYRTRDLIRKNKEKANKLQQKIQERGLGEKLGRSTFNLLNLGTGGWLKGFIERGMARGTGLKTLNYIELEKNIAKNLKLLEKANKSKTKSQLEKALNEIAKNVGIGVSKTGEVISKIPGIAEEAPRKSVQSLMEAARTKIPIGMTIKDVSKEGFKEAGVPQKLTEEAKKYKSAEEFVNKVNNSTEGIGSVGKIADSFNYKNVEIKPSGQTKLAKFEIGTDGKHLQNADGFLDLSKTLKDEKGNIFVYLKDGVDPNKLKKKTLAQFSNSDEPWNKDVAKKFITNDNGKTWKEISPFELGSATTGMTETQIRDVWNKANEGIKETPYKEVGSLTTKLLKKLEGKTTVNKQFISDLTNSPDLKQTEKDLIRAALKGEDSKINVTKFADKVKAELLPLKMESSAGGEPRYENIVLPNEQRGPIANYEEHVYNSPIKTSAGQVHFGDEGSQNYFGHTRVEDLPGPQTKRLSSGNIVREPSTTRRIIEVQSDLYQKGNLEREIPSYLNASDYLPADKLKEYNRIEKRLTDLTFADNSSSYTKEIKELQGQRKALEESAKEFESKVINSRKSEVSKLRQYNDPTAHFRMVREEIKKAAEDGKAKLQFPTGETAMKIEGLVTNEGHWYDNASQLSDAERRTMTITQLNEALPNLKPENLKVGMDVVQGGQGKWIITDVLGDGKFKAVPKTHFSSIYDGATGEMHPGLKGVSDVPESSKETFDISGKVDTSNPIYKFYEKEMGKYLKSKYNAKEIIDDQGVSWYEVDIKPEMKGSIEAFGIGAIPLATQINQDKK